ncbi:MAG TPA: L-histidine N(alpha)-methyltransferase [Ideonella sp.]|nr:L-histidine N(alpha)-methyltransferase [Ideonella sp.]
MDGTAPRQPRFVEAPVRAGAAGGGDERAAIAAGLQREPAVVAPKYFYDRLGSQLFAAITELDEYYPTRTEGAIFAAHGPAIGAAVGRGATLVDLGAGDCAKAMRLMPLFAPARYVAVDISVEFLRDALAEVQRRFPALEVTGVGTDFSAALELPADATAGRPAFLYPGSSIGNFTPDEALAFLRRVHARAAGGGLLIGVDLVKPVAVLEAAYDDALGVTAAFNLNLLRHLNRRLGADFDVRQWRHAARYDRARSRIEMHLEARSAVVVRWPGGERRFAAGERIHTENSYKYDPDDFAALLRDAGFAAPRRWSDAQGWFALYWAEA